MGERRLGNFNSCCRLCLSEKLGTLKSIFEDDSKGQDMARNIKHFLGVQISHNDKLTTMICENCFGQIHDWKLFKKNCDENQTKLLGWMNSWNDSNIGNISIRIKDEIVEDVDDRPIIVEDDDVVHVKTEQEENVRVRENSYGGEPMEEDMYDLPPPLTPHMPGDPALHGDDENGQTVDVYSDDDDDDENMSMLVPCIEFSEGREVLMNGNSTDDVNDRECTICGKEFSTPANRKKHERMIHLKRTKRNEYGTSNIQDTDYNRGETSPSELIELEKIQFAAGLRLQQRSLNQQVTIESATLSEVEVAYLDKCKTIVRMSETLTCACHGESFSEFKDLFVHLKKQRTWFSVFTCYNCLITFGDRSSYMKHYCHCPKADIQNLKRLTEGPVNPEIKIRIYQNFKCTKCNCTFGFHEDFCSHFDVKHMELLESDPPFTCICSKSFADIDDYKQHLHIACFLRHFCDICFDEFSSVDEFRLHCYKIHDKADGSTVELYDTYNKCKLDSNGEDLPSTSRYSLPNFAFKTEPNTERRQTINVGGLDTRHIINSTVVRNITKSSEPLNCPLCGKPYSSYHNMLRHYKIAHDKSGKILGCDYCPERFRLISELREHEITCHAQETANADDSSKPNDPFNFSCPDCGDLFQTVEEWTEHAQTHPAKTCEECGKEFKLQSELDQHRSVHLNIKVYRDSETQDYRSAMMSSSPLNCTICNKTFESKIELKKHNLLHKKMPVLSAHDDNNDGDKKEVVTKKYSCIQCNKHYISYGGIWDHNKKYHGGKSVENDYPKKCHHCDKLLNSKGAWVNHKRWHDRQSPSQSQSQINVTPLSVTTRRASRPADDDDESYHTCKRCFKVFSSKYNLRNHMRSHGINLAPNRSSTKTGKVNKTFWCDVCHQACPGYAELQEHKKEHIAKKSSKATQQALINDLQKKGTEFPCNYCNLTYTKNFNLLRHMDKHHPTHVDTKPPAIYCKYCKVPFEEVGDLNDHMQTEHEELYNKPKEEKPAVRKFPCKICKKVFDNSAALASHQGWHKRGKFGKKILNQKSMLHQMPNSSTIIEQHSFACRSCPRKFVNETALQIHILETHRNINTTILSMKCNSCKLTFDSKVKYDNHMQLHEVVESQRHPKAHPCNYCSAGFSRSDTLNAHVRQHHKEFYNDIFRCNECDRVFDKQNALTIHLKVHEKQRSSGEVTIKNANNKSMYFCSICDLGFVIAKDLRNHVVTAHPF